MSAVYFARVGDYVKIGFASNPQQRMCSLLGKHCRLIVPEDLDLSATPELIHTVRGCRRRDEQNMQLLFARHWVTGEWFRWSPALRFQMQTMRFVTHADRLKHIRAVRRELGIKTTPVKEERWGRPAMERIAASHAEASAPPAQTYTPRRAS